MPRYFCNVYDIQYIHKPWSIEATICFEHFLSYQNEHNCGSRRRRDRIRLHHFQEMVSKVDFRILNPPRLAPASVFGITRYMQRICYRNCTLFITKLTLSDNADFFITVLNHLKAKSQSSSAANSLEKLKQANDSLLVIYLERKMKLFLLVICHTQ